MSETIRKTVRIDGVHYYIELKHAPTFLYSFGFNLTIKLGDALIHNAYHHNASCIPFKEAVKKIVLNKHQQLKERETEQSVVSSMTNEFDRWDGVINI